MRLDAAKAFASKDYHENKVYGHHDKEAKEELNKKPIDEIIYREIKKYGENLINSEGMKSIAQKILGITYNDENGEKKQYTSSKLKAMYMSEDMEERKFLDDLCEPYESHKIIAICQMLEHAQ